MCAANELKAYWQAWQSAAYYQIPGAGSLAVAGKDREVFIQRQTTNDIHQLSADRALFTVLTSPTARILDVLYLLSEQDHIRALTLPGMGETTAGFLKSRIFFMDKVTVQDTSAELVQIYLVGPAISKILLSAFSISLPLIDQVVTLPVGDDAVVFFTAQPSVLPGGIFVAPVGALEALVGALEAAGATGLTEGDWNIIRIESGLPGPQSELSEAYTPLEVGLQAAISDSKGCFTGQEIIARQITYDKVTQQLRILRMEKPLEPGAQVRVEGKKAGVLTSAAESPQFGPVGLAVLKRPHHEIGTLVELETVDGTLVAARVVQPPLENPTT